MLLYSIPLLSGNNFRPFSDGTYLTASRPYYEIDFTKPSAIVLGTEASGLSDAWVKNSNANIIIPMQGKIDSMNVSNAAAVVVFEAVRQRFIRSRQ